MSSLTFFALRRMSISALCAVRMMLMFLTLSCFNAHAVEPFQVDPQLVQQLFEQRDPNRHVPKRPFKLAELTALFADARLANSEAGELTRRYLAISYPAGKVALLEVLQADLPLPAQQALLNAPVGSVQFVAGGALQEVLAHTPPALLDAVLSAPALTPAGEIDIAPLLQLNQDKFLRNPNYFTYVPMQDAQGKDYTLSTPRPAKHHLAAFLDKAKNQTLRYRFAAAQCQGQSCRSVVQGESVATFTFSDYGAACVPEKAEVAADCQYAGGFRRDYADFTEIEWRFENCRLFAVNGQAPQCSELLRTLQQVR